MPIEIHAQNMTSYECNYCNYVMSFTQQIRLLRVECPMCGNTQKLESANEITIIQNHDHFTGG